MDVIINNPAASAAPAQSYAPAPAPQYFQGYAAPPYPQGYGPGYGRDHGGPGFLLPLLLIVGGFLFFRNGRRRRFQQWRRMARTSGGAQGQGPEEQEDNGSVFDDLRRGKDKFFGDRAMDLARERLAKGEITASEFETLKKALE